MKKVINKKNDFLDEVVELEYITGFVKSGYDIKRIPVEKRELYTFIPEKLHASKPWNKYRPKIRK